MTTGPKGFDKAELLAKAVCDEARERQKRGEEPQTANLIVEAIRAAVKDTLEYFPHHDDQGMIASWVLVELRYGIKGENNGPTKG